MRFYCSKKFLWVNMFQGYLHITRKVMPKGTKKLMPKGTRKVMPKGKRKVMSKGTRKVMPKGIIQWQLMNKNPLNKKFLITRSNYSVPSTSCTWCFKHEFLTRSYSSELCVKRVATIYTYLYRPIVSFCKLSTFPTYFLTPIIVYFMCTHHAESWCGVAIALGSLHT